MLISLISTWWPVLPTVIAVASAIAKATPNETGNKVLANVLQVLDILALTTGKTVLNAK